jgi:uncharacterized repeat protein (TIGR01451 family)
MALVRTTITRRMVALLSALMLAVTLFAFGAPSPARADHFSVAAEGTLTLDVNPTEGDTMTVDTTTYTFTATPSLANDIQIGVNVGATRNNIETAMASHPTVDIEDFNIDDNDEAVLTAKVPGAAGNSIATTETFTSGSNFFDAATLGATTLGVDSPPATVDNPTLPAQCGIDIVIILDESTSISDSEGTQIENAYFSFLNGLSDTGSRAGVVRFSTSVNGTPLAYTAINGTNIAGAFTSTLSGYPGDGWTNWQDALEEAATYTDPDLVVMITDGDPTAYNPGPVTNAAPPSPALDNAVTAANTLKIGGGTAQAPTGAHILAVGIGVPGDLPPDPTPSDSALNLQDISGPDTAPPTAINAANMPDLDVIYTTFGTLQDALILWAEVLCSDIDLTKTHSSIDNTVAGPTDQTDPGDQVTYTFSITNTGTTALSSVNLDDAKLGLSDATCTTTTLAAGASTSCTEVYTFTQADLDAGVVNNTAFTQGTPPNIDPVSDDASDTVNLTQVAEIQIVKSHSSVDETVVAPTDRTDVGDQVTYTFSITNTGNVTLSSIDIDDTKLGLSNASCGTSPLVAGASTSCTSTYTLTQADIDAGGVDNTVEVDAQDPDQGAVEDSDIDSLTLSQEASIDIQKTHGSVDETQVAPTDRTDAGDQVTYTFSITNTGNVTLSSINIDDTKLGLSDASCGTSPLAPGASTSCTSTYTLLQADIDAGGVDNTVEVDSLDPDSTPIEDSDTDSLTLTQEASIDIQKTHSSVDETQVAPTDRTDAGDQVTYTFSITNTGNVTLDTIVINDAKLGISGATCTLSSLAPGASTSCTDTYTLLQADIDAGEVDNHVFVDADDPDDGTVGDDDTDEVTLTQQPGIEVVKTHSSVDETVVAPTDETNPGDQITYTFSITNTGNVTLDSIDLDDVKLGLSNATCGSTSLAPGASTSCTETYDLTQADIDAGQVDNTACVDSDDPDDGAVGDCDDDTTTVEQDPEIEIVKGPDNQVTDEGQDVTWTITVTNTGNVTLTAVEVTDALTPACDRDSGDIAALGSMAPGDDEEWTCTFVDVQNFLNNVADVDALDPNQQPVEDTDNSPIIFISASAAIGDLVWEDTDGKGDQDNVNEVGGEPGINGAVVDIFECLDGAACQNTVFVDTTTTAFDVVHGDGHYEFIGLEVGTYLVVVDTSSVTGAVTTPTQFVVDLQTANDVVTLADFGFQPELPVTGIDSDRLVWIGLIFLALGGIFILGAGGRRREN